MEKKHRVKIKLDISVLNLIVPESYLLEVLPRKAKKKLKKKIAAQLIKIACDDALRAEFFSKANVPFNLTDLPND